MWGKSRLSARRSRTLPMVLRFEMGRKFEGSDRDKPGFLRRSVMRACLNFDGKVACSKERFARWGYENRENAGAWFQQGCCNVVEWWGFVWHWVEQLSYLSRSDRHELGEHLSSVRFVKVKWRWRTTKFGGNGEFERINFLVEKWSQWVSQWFGNGWWKLFRRGRWVKNRLDCWPEWFTYARDWANNPGSRVAAA